MTKIPAISFSCTECRLYFRLLCNYVLSCLIGVMTTLGISSSLDTLSIYRLQLEGCLFSAWLISDYTQRLGGCMEVRKGGLFWTSPSNSLLSFFTQLLCSSVLCTNKHNARDAFQKSLFKSVRPIPYLNNYGIPLLFKTNRSDSAFEWGSCTSYMTSFTVKSVLFIVQYHKFGSRRIQICTACNTLSRLVFLLMQMHRNVTGYSVHILACIHCRIEELIEITAGAPEVTSSIIIFSSKLLPLLQLFVCCWPNFTSPCTAPTLHVLNWIVPTRSTHFWGCTQPHSGYPSWACKRLFESKYISSHTVLFSRYLLHKLFIISWTQWLVMHSGAALTTSTGDMFCTWLMVRQPLASGRLAQHMVLHNESVFLSPSSLTHVLLRYSYTFDPGLISPLYLSGIILAKRLFFLLLFFCIFACPLKTSHYCCYHHVNVSKCEHTQPQTHTASSPALPQVYL